MNKIAAIAAALTFTAAATGSAFADTATDLVEELSAPTTESASKNYICEYVIVYDAWGNYYYETVCY